MTRPRVVVITQSLMAGAGGGEMLVARTVEALQDHYEIILVGYAIDHRTRIQEYYGVSISDAVRFVRVPRPTWQARLSSGSLDLFVLARWVRSAALPADLFLSGCGEMDFGVRGIQYVNFPSLTTRSCVFKANLSSSLKAVQQAATRFVLAGVTGFNYGRMRANTTLTISHWVAGWMKMAYGIESGVLYPPAAGPTNGSDWRGRENGFLCLSSITPAKSLELVVRIVRRLRVVDPSIHLHIVGNALDEEYLRALRKGTEDAGDWLTIEVSVGRAVVEERIRQHRYGIHARKNEHFGISVAEMLQGGQIPFVRTGGGQAEIIAGMDELSFDSEDEAVERISRVLHDEVVQESLRTRCAAKGAQFSPERFGRELRGVVSAFLNETVARL